jgi:hydrogenase nickel incorporation protein HypA/HybF
VHEYGLVQALMQRVEAEARIRRATAAHRIVVRIGPLAGVDRELFTGAYDLCRPGTICQDAELVIADEDVTWCCAACGAPIAAGGALTCPTCGWPARLVGGDALVLERIELEVPDHV